MMKHIAGNTANSQLSSVHSEDVQPNACDVRIDKVFEILSKTFKISNDEKQHRGSRELKPLPHRNDGEWWHLMPGSYEVIMEGDVKIGEGEAGWIVPRSTLNRNGVFLTSGLYDSGYHGVMAGVLHVTTGPLEIKKGTRVGQFLLHEAEALHNYDGDYGHAKGHDVKYGIDEIKAAGPAPTGTAEAPVKLDSRGRIHRGGWPKGKPRPKKNKEATTESN